MHQVVSPVEVPAASRPTPTRLARAWYQLKKTAKSPTPYLTVFGILLWLFVYWLLCEGLKLPRFVKLPGPVTLPDRVAARPNPQQGVSIFTLEYYYHIYVSVRRVFIAFCIATSIGVPLGLLMGWSQTFRDYTFPILGNAAADPDPGLGAARDPDVPRLRDAGDLPRTSWRRCS